MTKVPVAQVTKEADMFFVTQAAMLFYGNLPFDVIDGSFDSINEIINYAHDHEGDAMLNPNVHDWLTHYTGVLLDPVKEACRDYADKMAHAPMTFMDHLYAHARGGPRNRQVRYTQLYVKYFGS